jgi:hypothetical protein
MRLLKLVLWTLLVSYSAMSSADDIVLTTFQVWSSASSDNVIRVTTPGQAIVNPDNCSDPDSYMVRTTMAKEAQARVFAVLLTARAMGTPVTVRISGCESLRPPAMPLPGIRTSRTSRS